MITAIEISNFKTFKDFKLTLSPFVAVAGLNAVGKSNLFDALELLSKLASMDLRSAFSTQRGDAIELFSQTGDDAHESEIRFAVEMLVEKTVKDRWGGEEHLKYTRLRYELHIRRERDSRGIERLYVAHEALAPIQRSNDQWYKMFVGNNNDDWRPTATGGRVPFISTKKDGDLLTVNLHQDKGSRGRPRPAHDLESTMLSSVTNTEFPHALAVRNEMSHWQFLQLNPDALRKPSAKFTSKDILGSDGSDLAATLFRMTTEDPNVLKHISRDITRFVADVVEVSVKEDEIEKRYVLMVKTNDGNWFSSQVLSEGTLRLLALCVLKYDQRHKGLICFEEPENGINPSRMLPLLKLLVDMATDFSDPSAPLRQVLVNTHSPLFIHTLGQIIQSDKNTDRNPTIQLYLARLNQQVSKGSKIKLTRMTPASFSAGELPFRIGDFSDVEKSITAAQLKTYLETATMPSSAL